MYLAALGDFEVLRDLFGKIVIPRTVFREIAVGGAGLPVAHSVQGAMASWLSVKDVANTTETERFLQAGLHPGESEAIVLAAELASEALLMDDSDGVKFAAVWTAPVCSPHRSKWGSPWSCAGGWKRYGRNGSRDWRRRCRMSFRQARETYTISARR